MDLYHSDAFIYTWRIENLAYNTFVSLDSPTFLVKALGNTKWHLQLVEETQSDAKAAVCYLRRANDDDGPKQINVFFRISIVTSSVSTPFLFEKGGCSGRVLVENMAKWESAKDTLDIVCRMWQREKLEQNMHCHARSRIGIAVSRPLWTVNLDSSSDLKVEFSSSNAAKLPIFTVHFSGKEINPITVRVRESLSGKVCMRGKISILTAAGETFRSLEEAFVFTSAVSTWTFPMAVRGDEVRNACCTALETDSVILHCEFSISDGTVMSEVENMSKCPQDDSTLQGKDAPSKSVKAGGPKTSEGCVSCKSLSEVLKDLYSHMTFNDITLRARDDQIFRAHSKVLRAKSPVFYERHIKKPIEKDTVLEVKVSDLSGDTLNRFLSYVYSEGLEDLQWESASQLLYAADKYEIPSLKRKCSSYLKSRISGDTVCEALALGHHRRDSALKSAAQSYICAHDEEVFPSRRWKVFSEREEYLACEVLAMFMEQSL